MINAIPLKLCNYFISFLYFFLFYFLSFYFVSLHQLSLCFFSLYLCIYFSTLFLLNSFRLNQHCLGQRTVKSRALSRTALSQSRKLPGQCFFLIAQYFLDSAHNMTVITALSQTRALSKIALKCYKVLNLLVLT